VATYLLADSDVKISSLHEEVRVDSTLKASAGLELCEHEGFVGLGRQQCSDLGQQLADQYGNAEPFPHIVLSQFLPAHVLDKVLDEFPQLEPGRFADAQSNLKTGYQLEKITSPYINSLINALNSAAFLEFLEKLTGIKGLISDP